jgi:hypothetical protein
MSSATARRARVRSPKLKLVRGRTIVVAAMGFEALWFVDAWGFIGLWAALLTVVVVVALTVAVIRTTRST